MSKHAKFRSSLTVALALVLNLSLTAHAVQGDKKKKKEAPQGTPVLWREPADITSRDLLAGPGGKEMQPDLSKVTFIKDETGGYSTKYRVKDGAGRVWVAKVGKEAQSETAASRLVWAAGYQAEVTYLAPNVTVEGKGTLENVRFEARPEEWDRLEEWKWAQNPFTGTRELQGLKLMMALLENWDSKDANNKIIYVPGEGGAKGELRYVISDLGATFGKTDAPGSPVAWLRQVRGTRNEPGDYAGDKFVEGVEAGRLRLNYEGKNSKMMRDISVEDAKWLGAILARLSDQQIGDAFRAANYTPEEVRLLTQAVRSRINELSNLR